MIQSVLLYTDDRKVNMRYKARLYLLNRMPGNSVLPTASYKMKHHQILLFLFMHGFTAIFLVSELGVKLQQNGLCKSPIILSVRYFWLAAPKRKSNIHTYKHQIKWNKTFKIILLLFLLDLEGRTASLGLPSWTKWALKLCKNCRNVAFHLEGTVK